MDLQELFTKNPLYQVIPPMYGEKDDKSNLAVFNILYGEKTFDMFCVECGSHSVFRQEKRQYTGGFQKTSTIASLPSLIINGNYYIVAKCSRNDRHEAMIALRCKSLSLQKIGQFPALADILTPDLKKYKSAIGEQLVREWSRAVGLAAHGIGAGSFVYLRRIIESLIEDAHMIALSVHGWDEETYGRARFSEKISMLSGHLPDFIVENKLAYAVLSKGVHELDEKTCLEYFPVLN